MARRATPADGTNTRLALTALLIDVLLVIAFAAIGRASHREAVLGPGGAGLAETAWPFLAGLLAGWVATLAWRRPVAPVRTGIGVWAATLVVGMLLRAVSGQGVAVAFVIVAGITLALFLIGWRVIASAVLARRARTR